jgi:hypothetical protein
LQGYLCRWGRARIKRVKNRIKMKQKRQRKWLSLDVSKISQK